MLGGGIAYGVGAGLQWATVAGSGALTGRGPRRSEQMVPYTLGMVLGGAGEFEGVLLTGIGASTLGKDAPDDRRRSRAMRAGGGVVLGLGAAAVLGAGMLWPTIREECSIGPGCGLAGVQAGGVAMAAGAGMIGYGKAIRPSADRPRSLPKKVQKPLIFGTVALANGYFSSALIGTMVWQNNREDPVARRVRNRMLIPVVGPWIYAAGPDAPLPMAIITGGLGALQIAGAAALTVAAVRAGTHRRRSQLTVVPNGTGLSLVGRF